MGGNINNLIVKKACCPCPSKSIISGNLLGAPGDKGIQGPIGSTGVYGPPGPTGFTVSISSLIGPTGPPGSVGSTGNDANTAETGRVGITGPRGPTGLSSNMPGVTGPPGPIGPQGQQGPAGPTTQSISTSTFGSTGGQLLELSMTSAPTMSDFISYSRTGNSFKFWGSVGYTGSNTIAGITGLEELPTLKTTISANTVGFPLSGETINESATTGIWTTCLLTDPTGNLPGQGQSFSGQVHVTYNSNNETISLLFRNCYYFHQAVTTDSVFEPLSFKVYGLLA